MAAATVELAATPNGFVADFAAPLADGLVDAPLAAQEASVVEIGMARPTSRAPRRKSRRCSWGVWSFIVCGSFRYCCGDCWVGFRFRDSGEASDAVLLLERHVVLVA